MRRTRYHGLDSLRTQFEEKKHAIRERLEAFRRIPQDEYFFELAYCILTPQSSAVHAAAAVEALRRARCFNRPERSAKILRRRAYYVRFHNTKAAHLAHAWKHFPEVAERLASPAPGNDLRIWLVRNVRGLGWKEASHFLRNIGFRDLAILDRHILRNLLDQGVLQRSRQRLRRSAIAPLKTASDALPARQGSRWTSSTFSSGAERRDRFSNNGDLQ